MKQKSYTQFKNHLKSLIDPEWQMNKLDAYYEKMNKAAVSKKKAKINKIDILNKEPGPDWPVPWEGV